MNHLRMVHLLMETYIQPGDHVVDMTVGNGHDMRKLLDLCQAKGHFTGFDIAPAAIARCREIAREYPGYSIDLHQKDHSHCGDLSPFRFAVYNLGYLPGSDKQITTKGETTIASLEKLLPKMQNPGMICLTVYRTHDHGVEAKQVSDWLKDRRDLHVRTWRLFPDDGHAPILYAIQRAKGSV